MRPRYPFSKNTVQLLSAYLLIGSALARGQAQPSGANTTDFNTAPPKDEILGTGKAATGVLGSEEGSPYRTVGPQRDGTIVASDNQTLTPAGKIVELGSPVRAKAIALNP